MTQLLKCVEDLIVVFHSYSGKEGDKYKLSKEELITLLQKEFLSACKDSSEVDKIMSELDENKDGEVDFQEFLVMVAALTVACNDFFIDMNKAETS